MIGPAPISWSNTGVPLGVLVLGALVLPRVLSPRETLSHRGVALAMAGTIAVLLATGAAVFGLAYGYGGAAVGAAFSANGAGTVLFFVRLSLKAALFWGPILALVWFAMAQGVEKRRGEDVARRDKV